MLRYYKHVDRFLGTLTRSPERKALRAWGIAPDELTERQTAAKQAIEPMIVEYGTAVSTPDMAVSLPSAAFLAALCRLTQPMRVLDAGSGFSSYVLRRFASQNGRRAEVWSVDDDEQWLKKTREYLAQQAVGDERLLMWDQLAASDERDFDLIFHDLGQARGIRLEVLPDICARISPRGLLLLDDFHKLRYRRGACRVLKRLHFEVVPLRYHTIDPLGRYAALARPRNGKPPR
ncbi:MAG: class I SAM-dependent methyltransferase [Planctomycetota bacterium]|jgi:predicted O-methyltransferase YrrM